MAEKKSKNPGRIPASELPPLKAWHLPKVKGGHVVRSPFQEKRRQDQAATKVVSEEADLGPLTVEALEKIRQQAAEDGFKQGQQQGLDEGRAKGEQLGHQAGLKRAENEINQLKAKLSSMMGLLNGPLQQQQQELEAALMRLVLDAAQTVVKAELATRPELMQQTVREALKALPHAEEGLVFLVNPDDMALLEDLRDQEQADWVLHADAGVTAGGIQVKGRNSYLDYTVEGRFTQVAEQWLSEQDESDDVSAANGQD